MLCKECGSSSAIIIQLCFSDRYISLRFLHAEMWAKAGHCYKAVNVTGILITFEPSLVSPCCEWDDGNEPFRLGIVGIYVLNLVIVTGHCSLLKRHVRDLHGTRAWIQRH